MSYVMTSRPTLPGGGRLWRRNEAADTTESETATVAPAADADAPLVQRAASGDVVAFGVLVQRYQRPMTTLVSRMTPNAEDVDDIVQELFIRAWKGLPRFRGEAQFSTWIYRIAVNTAIKHRSRRRTEATMTLPAEDMVRGLDALEAPADGDPAQGGDPFLATLKNERDATIRRAVMTLGEKHRTVVVLHYFEGLSCEEISQIVGCSLGTVWSRLHYACKRLRGVLERTGEAL